MTAIDELQGISRQLRTIRERLGRPEVERLLDALEEAANRVGRSWSGSWFGYHSRVYYDQLRPPPPGAHFSSEWGFEGRFQGTTGNWVEFDFDDVVKAIHQLAGDPDLDPVKAESLAARKEIEANNAELLSILESLEPQHRDSFLERLKEETENQRFFSARDFIKAQMPSGQFISRDTTALSQGLMAPPHAAVLAQVLELRSVWNAAERIAQRAEKAASHLGRLERRARSSERIGTNVFIGHGRSPAWRQLKDFIQDRLRLPWDEFNRVPVAGVTNIARLSEMLDAAAIAFIVLTAEDEQADGAMHARMNVIHEAGLFQGRLAFTRAIVLLEEGCEEFSNIEGLGQIRFPRGRIDSTFEEVRRVLEREGLLGDE